MCGTISNELIDAIKGTEPYIDHRKQCKIRSGVGPEREYCTCGVDEIVERLDNALQRATAPDKGDSIMATEITRSREEIEQRLEFLRTYVPESEAEHQANRAAIHQLEWVLSPDEAKEDPTTNTDKEDNHGN